MSKEYSVEWTEPTLQIRIASDRIKSLEVATRVAEGIAADPRHLPVDLRIHGVVKTWQ